MSCGGGGCGGGFSTGSNGLGGSKVKQPDYSQWSTAQLVLWRLFSFTYVIGVFTFLGWLFVQSDQSSNIQPQEILPESSVELASKTSSGTKQS